MSEQQTNTERDDSNVRYCVVIPWEHRDNAVAAANDIRRDTGYYVQVIAATVDQLQKMEIGE